MSSDISKPNIDTATEYVLSELNFGWDAMLIDDPIGGEISASNIAMVIKSSESLGEMIRRVRDALQEASIDMGADEVVHAIAADLVDGSLDGLGSDGSSAHIAAVANIVSAQILLEAMRNELRVNDVDASSAMDDALLVTYPSASTGTSTDNVLIPQPAISQARVTYSAACQVDANLSCSNLFLDQLQANDSPQQAISVVPTEAITQVGNIVPAIARGQSAQWETVNHVVRTESVASEPANNAPSISGAPASSVAANTPYAFTPNASDPDGDALSFSVANLPVWASFDSSNGTIAGTPGENDAGNYSNIVISVSDGTDTSALEAFDITVTTDTVMGGEFAVENDYYLINEGDQVVVTVTRSNSSGIASVYYSTASGSAQAGSDFIASENTVVVFPDGETSKFFTIDTIDDVEVETNESFEVQLYSPSTGYTLATPSTVSIELVSDDQPLNSAPTISGTPTTEVEQDNFYLFSPDASDADGDTLTFSIVNQPSWSSFNMNTGVLNGTPTNGDIGTTSGIVISVSDGIDTVSLPSFSITVTSAPAPGGEFNFAAATFSVTEGAVATLEITRSNASGGATVYYGTYGISAVHAEDYQGTVPTAVNFADGETSRTISIATIDDTTVEDNEQFEVVLSSPSTNYSLGSVTSTVVTINDNDVAVNNPPTINGNPTTSVAVNSTYSFTPSAGDIDGDALTFSISNAPSWATFNATSGTLSGTPGTGDAGAYQNIVISVSDGTVSASLAAFTITVTDSTPSTGSATLTWLAPTSNVDETPITDLAGFNIYYGTAPGAYDNVININNPGISSYVIENLTANTTYHFAVTAVDMAGNESTYSNPVSATIQ
jgi:hypothetical protein